MVGCFLMEGNTMKRLGLKKQVLLMFVAGQISFMSAAHALPTQGGYDNSAAATISTADSTMSITGKGANNILNWKTFSVESGEKVEFLDKDNYLNIVNGVDISRIYGTISGGNYVYLVNPYGILFGQGATLDNVGSFIASTRDISDINAKNFLEDSSNVTGVLYSDDRESRNLDYYPESSPYVPTISVAEINLTNVPESATQIILDGPSGVVLKNTDILDKVSVVSTRELGGEIGIGTDDFYSPISLTEEQQRKIYLVDGKKWKNYADSPNTAELVPYQWIRNQNELQAIDEHVQNNPGVYKNYMLANDIYMGYDFKTIGDISEFVSDSNTFRGTFEGLGYNVNHSYAQDIPIYSRYALFSSFVGTMRNINIRNAYVARKRSFYPLGIVANYFSGSMSNVLVHGKIHEQALNNYGSDNGHVGGLVGVLYTEDIVSNGNRGASEIRNSTNNAIINKYSYYGNPTNGTGGIVGNMENSSLYNVYNTGDISSGISGSVGGIVGKVGNYVDRGQKNLSAYNVGKVENYYVPVYEGRNDDFNNDIISNLGGIIGELKSPIMIGDTYNFGAIHSSNLSGVSGAIIGKCNISNVNDLCTYKSLVSDELLLSYHEGFYDSLYGAKRGTNTWGINTTELGINIDKEFAKYAETKNSTFIPSATSGEITNGTIDNNSGSNLDNDTPVSPVSPVSPSEQPHDTSRSVDSGGTTINDSTNNPVIKDTEVPNNKPTETPTNDSEYVKNHSEIEKEANIAQQRSWWERINEKTSKIIDKVADLFIKTEAESLRDDLKNNAKQAKKELKEIQKNSERLVVANDITGDTDKVPQKIVDDFVKAINDSLKYSKKKNQNSGNGHLNVFYGVYDGIPKVPDDYHGNIYSEEGVTYHVDYIGSVLVGNSVTAIIEPGKSNRKYQLHWSGGSSEQFISDLKDVGFDAFQAVIDACASDSLSILKVINDDALTDAYQVKVEGLTNPISKKALKQIVAKVAGNEFLDRVANIAIDAI